MKQTLQFFLDNTNWKNKLLPVTKKMLLWISTFQVISARKDDIAAKALNLKEKMNVYSVKLTTIINSFLEKGLFPTYSKGLILIC